MLIVYCEKCGNRIPQATLDAMGITAIDPERHYNCPDCAATAAPPVAVAASRSGAAAHAVTMPVSSVRAAKHSATSIQAGKRSTAVRPRSEFNDAAASASRKGSRAHSADAAVAPMSKNVLMIIGGAGVLVIAAALFLVLTWNSKKTELPVAEVKPPANEHKIEVAKPPLSPGNSTSAVPPPLPVQPPADAAKTPAQTVETAPPKPAELSPKELYDQAIREGRIKRASKTPSADPATGDLSAITDPVALREKLFPLAKNAPVNEVKRLGSLPPPAIAETAAYQDVFDGKNSHGWQQDYNSKVTIGKFEDEHAMKVEAGSDRVACYSTIEIVAVNARIKLHVFQKGLKTMRLSIMSHFPVRFNKEFTPPADGQWGDITVDASSIVSDGVKFQNMPTDHVEIHGIRAAEGNGAYFLISKIEIVTGGEK